MGESQRVRDPAREPESQREPEREPERARERATESQRITNHIVKTDSADKCCRHVQLEAEAGIFF